MGNLGDVILGGVFGVGWGNPVGSGMFLAAIVGDLFLGGGRRTGHWALSSSRLEVFLIFRN